MEKKGKKQEEKAGSKVLAGVAVAGAAAILGALFLYGTKDGKAKAKKLKGWMLKAKGEVLEDVESLKEVTQDAYEKIVDRVSVKYKKLMKDHAGDVDVLATELKKHWKQFTSKKTSKKN